jgi:putative ABC transport system ATP-binding protein
MSAPIEPPVIAVEGLTRAYRLGEEEIIALRDVSFTVAAGEMIALMGPSGSGKSTLMHLLGCLDSPTTGRYLLEGRDVGRLSGRERARVRNRRIGFVFQTFNLLPRLTALENVAVPLRYRRQSDPRRRAAESLARVGLSDRLRHRPNELSGGQRQRVAIARALVTDPAIILADEPTGNLDSRSGESILNLLAALNRDERRTVILVTHDANVAARAGRVLRLFDGALDGERRD